MSVRVMGDRHNNAELVRDLATLGYLRPEWTTLDATYGLGRFWKHWRPDVLVANDRYTEADTHYSFTDMLWGDQFFDVVVFDPPYKLNGTSTGKGCAASDRDYGVAEQATWQERHALIFDGIVECARLARRVLIIKCQDQVVSGRKRWQTRLFADAAEACGFRLDDMLHVGGIRPQPAGRRQVHAHQDYSTALVLVRES